MRKDLLISLRLFLLSAALGLPPFWYVYKIILPEAVDPVWMRLLMGGLALLFLLASFLFKYARERLAYFIYGWFYVCAGWLLYLTIVNNAHPYYIFADLVWFTVFAAFFQSMWSLLIFNLIVVTASVGVLLSLPAPLFSELLFTLMFPFSLMISLFQVFMKSRLEKQVLLEEQSFRTIFDESADGLFLLSVDQPRVVVDCNQQGVKMFGYQSKDEVVGKGRDAIFREGLTPADSEAIGREIQQNGLWRKSMRIVTVTGSSFWADMVIRVVKLGNQPILLVRVSDITRMREVEEELLYKNEELTKLNEMMVGREIRMTELKQEIGQIKGVAEKEQTP